MAGLVPPAGAMVRLDSRADGGPSRRPARRRRAPRSKRPEAPSANCDATGTVLVGDISNTLEAASALRDSGLGGVLSTSCSGSARPIRRGRVRAGVARWPCTLPRFQTVCRRARAVFGVAGAVQGNRPAAAVTAPLTVHLAESAEEIEFLRTGTGPIRELLEELGVWTEDLARPSAIRWSTSIAGLSAARHARRPRRALTDDGLDRLREAGAVVVTCPRSNIGSAPACRGSRISMPPACRVAIGTDSLASAPTLNMFDELAELRRIAPEVAAAKLLESATRTRRRGAGIRPRLRHAGGGEARGARRRRDPAGCDRCGRISGQWRRAETIRPMR